MMLNRSFNLFVLIDNDCRKYFFSLCTVWFGEMIGKRRKKIKNLELQSYLSRIDAFD